MQRPLKRHGAVARRSCLHNDQLPFCLQEGGFLAKKECNEKGELVPCVPFVRDNTAIKRHLQGKSRNTDARGVYANDALLRAMAATQGVFLVTINTKELNDICVVYPPESSQRTVVSGGLSWAEELVPKLMRQASGEADASSPLYQVILWNGESGDGGHFDATMAS